MIIRLKFLIAPASGCSCVSAVYKSYDVFDTQQRTISPAEEELTTRNITLIVVLLVSGEIGFEISEQAASFSLFSAMKRLRLKTRRQRANHCMLDHYCYKVFCLIT